MLPEKPKSEPSPEDNLLQEAIEAIRADKFVQAREILTKLLQTDQQNPDYWVWMSAAMETQKERLYCLQAAFRLDPTNASARRGLTLMGALPQSEPIQPFPMNHPRSWETKLKQADEKPKTGMNPTLKLAAAVGVIILALTGTLIGIGIIANRPAAATRAPQGTPRPTVTPYATNSNQVVQAVNTLRPLAELLSTPYTPTPIYAATPHGDIAGDSYKGAMRAYNSGQWELVGIMMAQVATSQPGSVDALYFIGESKRLSGQYQKAINDYRDAIAVNPQFAPSYLGRARANLAINPTKNVLEDLNKAIELDPYYSEAFIERGLYFFSRKDFKAAQTDLQQAASLSDSPLVEINLARVLLAQQENEDALEAAKRANELDVTMLEGYLVLGMAYRANGETEQAVEVLETYLQYQPDNADAFAVLGAAYYNRGEFDKAEDNLLQSLRLNKINVDGYFWLGQTNMSLGDYEKAVLNFQKARDLDPNSFDIGEGLAKAYMARKEYNNSYIALLKVEKSVKNPLQHARFIYLRALSLDQLNQPGAAFRDWTEILGLPDSDTTQEMRQAAELRVRELQTSTPTITPSKTAEPKLMPGTLRPTITPKPSDTRMPTSTPKGTRLPATPTP